MLTEAAWAGIAVAAGVGIGLVVGLIVRVTLRSEHRRQEVREIANPIAALLFWVSTAAGAIIALALTSPQTISDVPAELLDYLPRVLAAGLIVLAGRVLAVVFAGAMSGGVARVTGRRPAEIGFVIRAATYATAIVLALGQLGVDTTILALLIGAVAFALAAAAAILIGLGGRDIASEIAAGRYLRRLLAQGSRVSTCGVVGVVVDMHAASIEVRTETGEVVHLPYSKVLGDGVRVGGSPSPPAPKHPSDASRTPTEAGDRPPTA